MYIRECVIEATADGAAPADPALATEYKRLVGKILKSRIFFLRRTRHWSTPLGGLTRQLLKEGTTIAAGQSTGTGVPTHTSETARFARVTPPAETD